MNRLRIFLVASIVAIYATLSGAASPTPKPKSQSCPVPFKGLYVNDDHEYVFSVPPGLEGHWQSPCTDEPNGQCICLGSHGLSMPLPGGGALNVYSSFTAWLDDPTVADLLREQLWSFGGDPAPQDLQITEVQKTKIMGEQAFWVLGTFTGSDGRKYKRGMYIVLLQRSAELLVYLTAVESSYDAAVPMLNAVVKSLRSPTSKELQLMRGD